LQLRAAELILALARGGPLPAATLDLPPLDGPALEPLDVEEMIRPPPAAAASARAVTEGPQETPGTKRDEV
jgi:hypothetical protein